MHKKVLHTPQHNFLSLPPHPNRVKENGTRGESVYGGEGGGGGIDLSIEYTRIPEDCIIIALSIPIIISSCPKGIFWVMEVVI